MAAPFGAPLALRAITISSTRIDIHWDNGGEYDAVYLEARIPPAAFAVITFDHGSTEYYRHTGLTPGTNYEYRARGRIVYPSSSYSDYSDVDDTTTFSLLQAPTLLVVTAYSNTEIELVWKDNSPDEDSFRIERKEDGGGYAEIATIGANMDFYRDSGLDNTKTYTYRVKARRNGDVSAWSNEASVQPSQVPGAPGGAALSDITDEQMRLSWTAATGTVAGYKIERSVDAGGTWLEIIKVRTGVLSYLDKHLVPSQTYHFRVRAYGPGGNGAYSDIVNDTTDAQYDLSAFEKWLRQPTLKPCILVEINPKMEVYDFINTSGNVYEITITERGLDYDEVWEDGTALSEQTSVATVEANAGSFWCDYFNRKLYVHPSGSDNPGLHLIEAGFWLYFTNYQTGSITFSNKNYLPFFSIKNIPDISQEIKPLFAGSFSIGSGTITFKNPKIEGTHYFDKKYKRYIWRNRKIIMKIADATESTYANFTTFFTGLINKVYCDDFAFKTYLRDLKQELSKDFVLSKYILTTYPDLELDFENEPIIRIWGKKEGVVPIPIDWANRKFKFNDGRSNHVQEVKQNGTALTEGTDYYVDLQRSIITFDQTAATILEEDIIEVFVWGYENSASELIETASEIFIDLMVDHLGKALADLDLDSIYETKRWNEEPISLPVDKDQSFDDIFRTLEQTARAYLGTDPANKIGLKYFEEVPPSDSIYIRDHQISKYFENKDHKSLYKTIKVKYNENLQTQEWQEKSGTDENIDRKYGVDQPQEIFVYSQSPYSAEELAYKILELVNKPELNFTIPGLLYGKKPGDIIKLSRDRFFNITGSADEISFRLLKVHKQIQKMKTKVKALLHGGLIFVDNFDDLLRHPDWTDAAGNGTITESGGVLTVALAAAAHGDFWGATTDGPVCTFDFDNSKNLIITTKLNSYTPGNKTRAGLYITDSVDGTHGIHFGRTYRTEAPARNGLTILNMNVAELAYVALTTLPVWLRIRVNGSGAGSLMYFDYSIDGYNWTKLHVQEDESWSKIGLLVWNWTLWEAVSAPFEFLKVKEDLEKM
ncbi:MAG: fibronectin type III domain-containing protein [candidate division Zixibacteria bacterium]|nr:fibronectin type III domain-containing protein [candidate division Zixibacteria bacterium]